MTESFMLGAPSDIQITKRIGAARILRFAFNGNSLESLRAELQADVDNPGAAMDLSVVEQILGHSEVGLRLQNEALRRQRIYRSPGSKSSPRLRVLALAAPLDVGGNIPIEFLIADSNIELTTLYIVPGHPIDRFLPDHDVAILVMSEGDDCAESLRLMMSVATEWPRPLLNFPERIARTDRDGLFSILQTIPKLKIPVSVRISRPRFAGLPQGKTAMPDGLSFPMIVRPVGSHAGKGLERLENSADIESYLNAHADLEFFLSRFIDYSSGDGLFRKYRIVFIDGKPFACHMAISNQWKIWYLNADMFADPLKRAEEQHFMERFNHEFGLKHEAALAEVASRLGLDYFSIDCAETKDGNLLIFEAGVAMVVHDMDPPDLYPYKVPQMKKIFSAFTAMLDLRASASNVVAACGMP